MYQKDKKYLTLISKFVKSAISTYRMWIMLLLLTYTVSSIQAQTMARPREGDGVSTFLARYGVNTKEGRRAFIRMNKKKLTAKGGLILGRSYRIPTPQEAGLKTTTSKNKTNKANSSITEPLFGKNHEKVSIKSQKLKGACFYLVSGHVIHTVNHIVLFSLNSVHTYA